MPLSTTSPPLFRPRADAPGGRPAPSARRRASRAAALALAHTAVALLALGAPAASAQPPSPGCDAGLERLQANAAARPADAETHARLGRCYLALGRTDAAPAALDEAARLDPSAARFLEAAAAMYHARRLDEAEARLARAEPALADDPELHLYRGLLLLERGEAAAAAARLERSRRLDPARVEPVASYFAGLAWEGAGDRARADEALARIAHDWPGTPWADSAARALERVRGTGAHARWRPWAEVEIGVEGDTNVVRLGREVTAAEISDERDVRAAWGARGGVERSFERGHAGVALGYAGSEHGDLDDYDVHYSYGSLYGAHRLGERTDVRVQLDTGYAWVGGDPFAWTYDSSIALRHGWAALGASELFGELDVRDYLVRAPDLPACTVGGPTPCGRPRTDESEARNRDGVGVRAGVAHLLPVGGPLTELRVHAAFDFYQAEGDEYDFAGGDTGVALRADGPFDTKWRAAATYEARRYAHPSTFANVPQSTATPAAFGFPGGDRRDDQLELSARVERALGRGVSISGRWRFERRFSNADVFDYRRHVVGLFLTWRGGLD
ncbi:MAG: hypothetical protein R3E88_15050 [Myxococcota bacterium]